jgi:hypothetical protein
MDFNYFIRHKRILDKEEVKIISEGGISYDEHLYNGIPFVSIVMELGDESAITMYFGIKPGAVYMFFYYGPSFFYLLGMTEHDGQHYFSNELKEKCPTFYKVLYDTMLYKNKGNSNGGVFFQEDTDLFFVKKFIMPNVDEIDPSDLTRMAAPYIEVGIKLAFESMESDSFQGYEDISRIEMKTDAIEIVSKLLRREIMS